MAWSDPYPHDAYCRDMLEAEQIDDGLIPDPEADDDSDRFCDSTAEAGLFDE